MIRRFYVHNFRCLENFELRLERLSSVLLIGKNGSGKTTVGLALEILQKIGRDINRVKDRIDPGSLRNTAAPVRFEVEADIHGKRYAYNIAFEFPEGFKELRVLDEEMNVDGQPHYSRRNAQVTLARSGAEVEAKFRIDWHLVALPIVQERSLTPFKQWLARVLILGPVPSLISGQSNDETLQPDRAVGNLGAWFAGLIAHSPSAYLRIDGFLKQVMPDFKDLKNPLIGRDARSLVVQYSNSSGTLSLDFDALSDGEKCFLICAMVLAANEGYGPLLCFWDEPDNYLALDEVGQFVMALRRSFAGAGQFIATSHNPEAIRKFSDENTLCLYRRSHLEPTNIRPLSELEFSGDLVGALARGSVEP